MTELRMDVSKRAFKKFLTGALIVCLVVGLMQGFSFSSLKAGAAGTTTATTPTTPTVTKIKVQHKPTKTSYLQGDTIATKGMKIKVTYSDLSTKVITKGFKVSLSKITSSKTTQKVTVTYKGAKTTFTIKVSPIAKLKMIKRPTKYRYYQGQALSTKGMKLIATFKNKKTKTITTGFTTSGFSTKKSSKVTVKYLGKKVIFYTAMKSTIKSITIKAPTKATVKGSKSIKTTGMKITVKYKNGKVLSVKPSSGKITGYNKNKKGTQKLTFTYGGKKKTFKVKVK